MPEFTTVSVTEAKLRTTSGRQKAFLDDYVTYIQQLPKGQAGRLRIGEQENPLTIRRRLAVAAQTLGINLIIKRSGNDVYFWREATAEQPSTKRRYTRRSRQGSPGTLLPPTTLITEPDTEEQLEVEEETTALDQGFSEPEYPAADKYPGMVEPIE
jgi:hypothetical protein